MEKLDNVVIKNLSPEMGKKIVKYFKEMGYDTYGFSGCCTLTDSKLHYYGVRGGIFGYYTSEEVRQYDLKVITLPEEEKQFTKSDLKAGMWVETRNRNQYLVLTDVDSPYDGPQKLAFIRDIGFLLGNGYNNDLIYNFGCKDFDIMKVYGGIVTSCTYNGISPKSELIWERKEAPTKTKLTLEQLAEKAGYSIDEIEITVNNI